MMDSSRAMQRVHRTAIAALAVTIGLTVGIGGTITSAEVGMAYPTWPDINGGSLFSFFYGELAREFGLGSVVEHTHRQAGALTGLLALLAAALAWTGRGIAPAVRWLALAALLGVIVQGLIGAFRVLGNTYGGAILHAVGAQAIVVVMVALVKRSAAAWREPAASVPGALQARLRLWSSVGVILLFVNLFAAASLRHKQGAFAGHLTVALAATCACFLAARLARRAAAVAPRFRAIARRLHLALGIQLLLGAAAWLWLLGPRAAAAPDDRAHFLVQAALATAHLLCGVLVMAAAASLWIESRWRTRPGPQGPALESA